MWLPQQLEATDHATTLQHLLLCGQLRREPGSSLPHPFLRHLQPPLLMTHPLPVVLIMMPMKEASITQTSSFAVTRSIALKCHAYTGWLSVLHHLRE
jgi:hypothetical protein